MAGPEPIVVFVAPFFLDATLRFVEAAAEAANGRLALVSQDPESKLPDGLRARLAGHYRIDRGLDPDEIARAVSLLGQHRGPVRRLIGTLEDLQVPLGQVRDRLGIPGMGAEVARNFRDKSRMKDVLRAAGLPCARHRLVTGSHEAAVFAHEVGFPLIVKPPDGAAARGTFRVESTTALGQALRVHQPGPGRPVLLEEFVRGEEHSFDSVTVGGKVVWHSINRYAPAPLHVLANSWIQWCVLLPRETDDPRYAGIREAGPRALRALGLEEGLSHMEWFLRPDGSVAISEVGARPPGAQFTSLLSWAHDTDMYRAWGRLAVTGEFDPPARRYAAGAAYLRGQGEGRVRAVHGLEQAQREVGKLVVEARLPREGQAPTGSYEGEGFIILRDPDTEVVRRGLERVVELVRVELG